MIFVCSVPNLSPFLATGDWMALARGDGLEVGLPCSGGEFILAARFLGDQQAALRILQAPISWPFNRLPSRTASDGQLTPSSSRPGN